MSQRRVVVHASAGTGKTHALSRRLIELLFDGAEPDALLATTFTRKAAGEIHERVHERLLGAVLDDGKREALFDGEREAPSVEACRELLLSLLRGPQALRVQTLDGYFASLAGPFALELGVPPDWRMASEVEGEQLVTEALEGLMTDVPLLELVSLLRSLRLKAKEGARATADDLAQLVGSNYARWRDAAPDAYQPEAPPETSATQLEAWLTDFEDAPVALTAKQKPNANWVKARAKLLDALRDDVFEPKALADLVKNGFAQMLLSETDSYYRAEPPEGLREAAAPLFSELGRRAIRLCCAITAAHGRFMERLHDQLALAKERAGVLRFEDLPHRLAELAPGLVARRLGNTVRHLLLDEFQDTSLLQWTVLARQAREAVDGADDTSFFCVGDLKQALYAWRGGEARLLAGLAEKVDAERDTLTKNYRSSPVVLAFVERVLGNPSALPLLGEEPGSLRAARAWEREWETPVAADEALPGRVAVHRVLELAGTSAADRRLLLAGELARRVRELLDAAPDTRVGVLVRTNKSIAPLLQALGEVGVRAGGAGGACLTDSHAVRCVLAALRLAEHPGDDEAWLCLRLSPLADSLGLADEAPGVCRGPAEERAAHRRRSSVLARSLRARWERDGAALLASELIDALAANEPLADWDRLRTAQLVASLESWEAAGRPLRLDTLLRQAEEERVALPGGGDVEVLTIHQAKGLDYDAVFLPELEGGRVFSPPTAPLVVQPDPFAPAQSVLLPTRRELMDLDPYWSERRVELVEQAAQADLCALYVALTRARRRVEILLTEADDAESGSDAGAAGSGYARLLREVLPAGALQSGVWLEDGSVERPEDPPADAPAARPAPAPSVDVARLLEGVGASATTGAEADDELVARLAVRLAEPSDPTPRWRGLLWHLWCERLGWLEPGAVPEDASWREVARGSLAAEGAVPDALDLDAERAAFERALAAPPVRAVFERPEGEVELWRERALLGVDPGGRAHTWRFDRVHLRRADGVPSEALIVDFKTGGAPAGGTERDEAHARQLSGYRELLAERLALPTEQVRTQRVYLGDGTVV